MSNVGIFIAGVVVTLAVTTALALLVWGAIQDGRIQEEFEKRQEHRADDPSAPSRPAPAA